MLQTKFYIKQAINDCNLFVIDDRTGQFDAVSNPNGYGVSNPVRSSLTFLVTRKSPSGEILTTVPTFDSTNISVVCGDDWMAQSGVSLWDDCGCRPVSVADSCNGVNDDGCYTYTITAKDGGGAVVSSQEIIVLHSCKTKARIRKAGFAIATGSLSLSSSIVSAISLQKWALAWDVFQSVIEKPEPCCEEDTEHLEAVDLILRQIGY